MKDENKKMSIAETFENIVAQLNAIGEAEPADEPLGIVSSSIRGRLHNEKPELF